MAILIINQSWSDNLGDVAIGKVMAEQFSALHPILLPFAPVTANCQNSSALKKLAALKHLDKEYKKWINSRLDDIKEKIDGAIIGGGELLASNMNFNSAMLTWMTELKKRHILVFVYGVGGGATNMLFRMRYKKALKCAKRIFVRDNYTQKIVKNNYRADSQVYPDVVFLYSVNNSVEKKDNTNKRIMCNVMSYQHYAISCANPITKNEYFEKWKSMIEHVADADSTLVFSSTTKEDRETTTEFVEYLNRNNIEVCFAEDLETFWNLLGDVDCIISGRMHSMILALQKNCQCIPFVFKDKLEVFKKEYIDNHMSVEQIQEQAAVGVNKLLNLIVE